MRDFRTKKDPSWTRFWEEGKKKNFGEELMVREKMEELSRYGVDRGDGREGEQTCE
jgi:hypothetical protein